MFELREIAKLVTQHRRKFRESLQLKQQERSNEHMLRMFKGLVKDEFRTDEQAAKVLYGIDKPDKRFRMLKGRLVRRMMDDLYFFDQSQRNLSPYLKANFRCAKNFLGARILLLYGARTAATKMFKTVAADAEKFRLFDMVMLSSLHLRSNYSFASDPQRFNYYNKKFHEALQEFTAESYSHECLETIYTIMGKTTARKTDIAERAEKYVAGLEKMGEDLQSYHLHFNLFRLKIIAQQQRGRYMKAMHECDMAMAYLYSNRPFMQRVRLAELALIKMECCLLLRNHELAEENEVICQKYFPTGHFNWMIFQEIYLLTCLHTAHYEKAYSIYQAVINQPNFAKLGEARLEKWKIFHAYMHILKNSGHLTGMKEDDRFNLPRFMNDLPIFSRDKLGLNLSILIVQFTYLLQKGDFEKVAEKMEMLQSYRSRYLAKNKVHFRSNIFLKMLFFYAKYYNDRKKLTWRTDKLRQELKLHRESAYLTIETHEVIPYEILWDLLIKATKPQK